MAAMEQEHSASLEEFSGALDFLASCAENLADSLKIM
jgi:hypothetical protein